jgi:hypothetical protein
MDFITAFWTRVYVHPLRHRERRIFSARDLNCETEYVDGLEAWCLSQRRHLSDFGGAIKKLSFFLTSLNPHSSQTLPLDCRQTGELLVTSLTNPRWLTSSRKHVTRRQTKKKEE